MLFSAAQRRARSLSSAPSVLSKYRTSSTSSQATSGDQSKICHRGGSFSTRILRMGLSTGSTIFRSSSVQRFAVGRNQLMAT